MQLHFACFAFCKLRTKTVFALFLGGFLLVASIIYWPAFESAEIFEFYAVSHLLAVCRNFAFCTDYKIF